jgi:hypothetical protein
MFASQSRQIMSKEKSLLSSERLNSYGFWVLTDGIDISEFVENPIMLYMHQRPMGLSNEAGVIGGWDEVEKEGNKLYATPRFDEKDEFALKIKSKVEQGFLKKTSISFEVIELSTDPKFLKPGQTRPTVVKCKLLECSIVDRGSNTDGVILYKNGKLINLSDGIDNELPLIKSQKTITTTSDVMELNEIKLAAGLDTSATEIQLAAQVKALKLKADKADTLEIQLQAIKAKEKQDQKAKQIELLDAAIAEGRLNATQRESWEKLFEANAEHAQQVLATLPVVGKLSGKIADQPGGQITHDGKTYKQLHKEGKLMQLKKNDLETFKALYKAEYGTDYVV